MVNKLDKLSPIKHPCNAMMYSGNFRITAVLKYNKRPHWLIVKIPGFCISRKDPCSDQRGGGFHLISR